MRDRESWDAATFERLYAERSDPWDFATSDYEQAKYAASLAALPQRRFAACFEVGCSIGVLTAQLAARCDALLAVDVADAALRAARERCAGQTNVHFAKLQVPREWPPGSFDLMVFSEVLYFLSPDDVGRTARLAADALLPGGVVLLVNWIGETDSPCTGDEAVQLFLAAAPRFTPALQQREPRYRLDVLHAMG